MSTLLFLVLGRADARGPLPLGWPMDEAPTSVRLSFPSWTIPAPTHNGHAQHLSLSTFARAHTGLSTVGSWGLTSEQGDLDLSCGSLCMPQDAQHEDYLVDPLSSLTAPVHTPYIKLRRPTLPELGMNKC